LGHFPLPLSSSFDISNNEHSVPQNLNLTFFRLAFIPRNMKCW
jgi:hypothetical protein